MTKIREYCRQWYASWLLWLTFIGLPTLMFFLLLCVIEALVNGARTAWNHIRWGNDLDLLLPGFFNSALYSSWKEHRNAR